MATPVPEMPMADPPVCASCGALLQETKLGLLCPACLMERVVSAGTAETPAEARAFGEYQLLEEIGRGGVGVVYRAWHSRLERTVALKMLLGGPFAGPELTARFGREVKIVARMRHAGIVALYEAGEVDGVSFFTMELIEGRTLAALVRDGPIAPERAALYVEKAARSVQHAHEHHILHRDLKPSNILIDSMDEPKVADFGLARLWLDAPEATVNINAMGSPPYMAPEQVSGTREAVGPSADIYALGAVLYHLLTGRPPHQGASVEDILVHVRETSVVAPHLLNPSVPRDLETICLKCLEKDVARRYPAAGELADDLARFRNGETVLARPAGLLGRAWRWGRRNRRLAAALAALAILLAAGAADIIWQGVHNTRERERLALESYVNGVEKASLAADEGDYSLARTYLAALANSRSQRYIGFEWRLLWNQTSSAAELDFHPHDSAIVQVAFSPDGRRIATNSLDGTANWIDLANPKAPAAGLGHGGGWALSFSTDGKSCYIGEKRADAADLLRQVDLATGATLWSTPGYRASLSSDGSRLAVTRGNPVPWVAAGGGAEVWDTTTRRRMAVSDGNFRAAALSPDGKLLALVPSENLVLLREALSGVNVARLPTGGPQMTAVFSPDGKLVASCGRGDAYLWRVEGVSLVAELPHPWLRVWDVAFSPDSSRLATTCSDRAVRVWDTSDGRLLCTFRGHADEVWSAAFSPDGRTLASAGKDGTVLVWPGNPDPANGDIAYHGWSRPLFSLDGNTVALSEIGASPSVLIVGPGRVRHGPDGWAACGISADGRMLLLWSAQERPFLRWWSLEKREFAAAFSDAEDLGGHLLMQTGLSSDGRRVFQAGKGYKLRIWDAVGGAPIQTLELPHRSSTFRSFALSRDGRWLAWSYVDDDDFWIEDLGTGQAREIRGHKNEVNSVAFSPSGAQMASASSDGSVRLWDCLTGSPLAVLPGHPESANDVAFSPDGRTLASLGTLQSLRFWNVATGRELLTIKMPEAGSYLKFSPDGQRLAVTLGNLDGGDDRGVRILNAPTGDSR
jgi:WD40 repeat protein